VCVVGKALHAGGPGKKIARRLFSGGIFIGTRAMLAAATGVPRASRWPARLVVAGATHPPPDQSARPPPSRASSGVAAAASRGQGWRATGYEKQPPTTGDGDGREATPRTRSPLTHPRAESPG